MESLSWTLEENNGVSLKEYLLNENDNTQIKVIYCGICGSDLHLLNGEGNKKRPLSIGHEFVGIISKFPPEGFSVGDKVIVTPGCSCGKCDYCIKYDNQNCCEHRVAHGMTLKKGENIILGGMSTEVILAPNLKLYKLPDNLSLLTATITEPVTVAIRACSKMQGLVGNKVLVVGSGPIGTLCSLLLISRGYEVKVVEKEKYRVKYLKQNFNFDVVDAESINDKEFDAVLECTGIPETINYSIKKVRKNGKLILVGNFISNGEVSIDPSIICNNELEIYGSVLGAEDKYEEALSLLSKNEILWSKVISHILEFEDYKKGVLLGKSKQCMKIIMKINGEEDGE
ncbi:Alcohol dehydrogenase [Lactococcus lactis subsp. lactis]|uniref:zinc-dependent alcohol dehydrogenase n=1 Tax=Lactococcus lactis TaxID=1358 RepID=UPI00071DA477|nr:alcohol dehydrogenase catalytic domain-containing protein [Lactococcus lactis]KST91477.1 Alcohol dehydrogenase [Lactococcus lactis subsp. lactis]